MTTYIFIFCPSKLNIKLDNLETIDTYVNYLPIHTYKINYQNIHKNDGLFTFENKKLVLPQTPITHIK